MRCSCRIAIPAKSSLNLNDDMDLLASSLTTFLSVVRRFISCAHTCNKSIEIKLSTVQLIMAVYMPPEIWVKYVIM